MPSSHRTHASVPPFETEPSGQSSHFALATLASLPASQRMHELEPGSVATVPVWQGTHADAPVSLIVPAGQSSHSPELAPRNVPALHTSQNDEF